MIPIIDLFAGPGGLGEGFSSITDAEGKLVFQTIMSVEKDPQAHQTLRLRSYVRKIAKPSGSLPRVYITYMQNHDTESWEALRSYNLEKWEKACFEAVCAELEDGDYSLVEKAQKRLKEYNDGQEMPWVLIGGPPCQAYSLAGRSRRAKERNVLEADKRQTLYKCYLAFINELKPTVFVMENVKGLLSAVHSGDSVLCHIIDDMHDAGYEIRSLVKKDPECPRDYVVEAERYGIPQARHRVILLGVKKNSEFTTDILKESAEITLREVLQGIPKIRSGFSERNKDWRSLNWADHIDCAVNNIIATKEGTELKDILRRVQRSHPQRKMAKSKIDGRNGKYNEWYRKCLSNRTVLTNHEARTHLGSDLDRYLFCAAYAEKHGVPAKLYDFPKYLLPAHKNVAGAKNGEVIDFPDRFRVQLYDRYSTTITSHISKDGHYYIHPDPEQCRSLTVREAARLQTFPDDYFFEGNRTSQYTQVGNAVPPLLAQQIAVIVAKYLGKDARCFVDDIRDDGDESWSS